MPQKDAALDPAVAYLRKSTKGERDGREKQEKSLAQQRAEIIKLARGRFRIVKWFEDEGISGWKRGAKRPDFQRMIAEASSLGAKAILCDNIDRFSRATYDDVHEDTRELRKAGVRWIVTASHGEYDLGHRNDIAEIIKFAAAVWAAHEFSRNLGRRIARARRDAAEDGKRTGGAAPYALVNDGTGGLKHGDPEHVRIVRWLFEEFVNHLRSLCWLAGDLNARKVPGPSGGPWYPKSIGILLRQRAYRGDFLFNRVHAGQFFGINGSGEVVESAELDGAGKVFTSTSVYDAVIEPALFDAAQRRLDTLAKYRGRRKRAGYALTGVLFCDHCGSPMFGLRVKRRAGKRSPTVYRCNANSRRGRGACRQHQIREDAILPWLLRALGQEINDLKVLLSTPPEHLRAPHKERAQRREQTARARDELAAQIAKGEEAILDCADKRTRQALDKKVSAWRDELDRLDAELAAEPKVYDYSEAELAALSAWWDDFWGKAVSVPVPAAANLALAGGLCQDPNADESAILVDPRKVNEALLALGAEVRLRWEEETYTSMTYKQKAKDGTVRVRGGVERKRFVLARGRFRLGQREGELPVGNGAVLGNTVSRTTAAASATVSGPSRTWSGPTARGTRPASATGSPAASTSSGPPTARATVTAPRSTCTTSGRSPRPTPPMASRRPTSSSIPAMTPRRCGWSCAAWRKRRSPTSRCGGSC
jgi:DNA invertase Pin-like site-specific DNA recombinase